MLHRGTEKLIESIYITSIIGYFDRLDYVSNISQELLFIQLVERLINCYLIDYISLWRTFFLEFYKNLNHLLNITTHAIDLGLFITMLWIFDEREKLINNISMITGTRFHVSLLLLGNLRYDLTLNWIRIMICWLFSFGIKIKELNYLLTNTLWNIRLIEIGIIKKEFCLYFGISGIISRSIAIYIEIRLLYYEFYYFINFIIFTTLLGDCLDRYVLRLNEIIESCRILYYILLGLFYSLSLITYCSFYIIMEWLINDFLYGFIFIILFIHYCISIESSKGIYSLFILWFYCFIIYIITNDFLILNEINLFSKYYLIGDLIALLGSIDFVLGSVDLVKHTLLVNLATTTTITNVFIDYS